MRLSDLVDNLLGLIAVGVAIVVRLEPLVLGGRDLRVFSLIEWVGEFRTIDSLRVVVLHKAAWSFHFVLDLLDMSRLAATGTFWVLEKWIHYLVSVNFVALGTSASLQVVKLPTDELFFVCSVLGRHWDPQGVLEVRFCKWSNF